MPFGGTLPDTDKFPGSSSDPVSFDGGSDEELVGRVFARGVVLTGEGFPLAIRVDLPTLAMSGVDSAPLGVMSNSDGSAGRRGDS
jgi:hypothetical protein